MTIPPCGSHITVVSPLVVFLSPGGRRRRAAVVEIRLLLSHCRSAGSNVPSAPSAVSDMISGSRFTDHDTCFWSDGSEGLQRLT